MPIAPLETESVIPNAHAIIFDMDGLLIDSEPLWQEAAIEVLATVGLHLTPDLCSQTLGLRFDEAVQYWHSIFPWEDPPPAQIARQLLASAHRLIDKKGIAQPGARYALDMASASGSGVALASSSPMMLIEMVVGKLGIAHYFNVINSAEHEQHGKPHPAVYLKTAKKLGVDPTNCIALEDSVNGVLAAKAAGMKCIAVPERNSLTDSRFEVADIILPSLEHLAASMLTTM
ncbi:MAG: hexitol phosphatase HxpB [Dehalococcoidia bacterium]|nr:hexitol phosphatase HxpB [Dehalococcoidia bacterium]